MLQAGLGVAAALAFVLALGAFCLWALKRWGTGTLLPRSRVPVEVVQRIQLGPKVGLAVVRVGEKVMAISVGEGGVRTLFELDEADRQQILASSTVPMPQSSSARASAGITKFLPGVLSGYFGRSRADDSTDDLPDAADLIAASLSDAPVSAASAPLAPSAFAGALARAALEPAPTLAAPTLRSGAPVTYARNSAPLPSPDREFRAVLGLSLSGATRLVVFLGAMALAAASAAPARAQVAPPVSPPVVQQPAPAVAPGTAPAVVAPSLPQTPPQALPQTLPQALPQALPQTPPQTTPSSPATAQQRPIAVPTAPQLPVQAQGRVAPARTATPAAIPGISTATKKGNGASVTPGGAGTTRPVSAMKLDSAAADSLRKRAEPAGTAPIAADDAIMRMMPQMDMKIGDAKDGGLRLNGTVGIVVMMGLLTLLPTLLLMMTGFTRILIVLHFLKQAMGTQGAPPAQLLAGLALLLTGFVMAPTLTEVNRQAITPWLDGQITQVEMMKTGVKPMREFMLRQTRKEDLKTFVELSRMARPNTVDDVPLHVLMSAFVASELRTSFQIGFMIYLPFIIIDAVVASVLMSMGMMMLPPAMISLPFKLLLFVLVDGWTLTIQSLVQSFK